MADSTGQSGKAVNWKPLAITGLAVIVLLSFHPRFGDIVTLIGNLTWPAILLYLIFLLSDEIRDFFRAIVKKAEDPKNDMSLGKDGLEFRRQIEKTQATLEELKVDQAQTQSLALQAVASKQRLKVRAQQAEQGIPPELLKLAEDYMHIDADNWRERVRLKDAAAREMANFVIVNDVNRDLLGAQHQEGLILALAAASHALPRKDDFTALMRVSHEVTRLHVKYRVVLALGRLFEQGMVDDSQKNEVLQMLDQYKHGADASLLGRIKQTERMIKEQ